MDIDSKIGLYAILNAVNKIVIFFVDRPGTFETYKND